MYEPSTCVKAFFHSNGKGPKTLQFLRKYHRIQFLRKYHRNYKGPQKSSNRIAFYLRLRGQTRAPAKEGKPSLAWVCTCVCVWGRWRRAHPSSSWWSCARSRSGSRPSSSGTTAAARPWPTSPHCCLTPRSWCPGSVARENICWFFFWFFFI